MSGANHRPQKLEVASGLVLLVPLIGLPERERKVWMTRLDVEARACSAQMNFRPGLWVREMKHYNSLPSTIRTSRGAMSTAHAHRHYVL